MASSSRCDCVAGGEPQFFRPDGKRLEDAPRSGRAGGSAAFEAMHAELGIHEEIDYGEAVRVVCGLTDDELGMSVSDWLNANGFGAEAPDRSTA